MKKLLICALVFISVFVIYLLNMDKDVYYLALGNSNRTSYDDSGKRVNGYSFYVNNYFVKKGISEDYVYEYSNEDSRIIDIINDIKENKKIKNHTLKNSLIKADLVTICIDADDLFSKLNQADVVYNDIYNYIDDLTLDLESLFKLMREYCKEDIIFIGYYNPFKSMNNSDINDVIDYLNRRYKEMCIDYDIKFISLDNIDIYNKNSFRLDSGYYKKVGDLVINVSNKLLFDT